MKNKLALAVFLSCSLSICFTAHAGQGFVKDHELTAGPVKITAHEDCDEYSECTVKLVFTHENEQKTIENYYSRKGDGQFVLNQDQVAWVANRYVTLEFHNGGNCRSCSGVYVVALDDGKFYDLGETDSEYENGFWTKTYTGLESNSLTGHASAPTWSVYYSVIDHKLNLDMEKTCSLQKKEYEKTKAIVLHKLPPLKKGLKGADLADYENEVGEPLLYALGFAKFCGLNEDYKTMWAAAGKKVGRNIVVTLTKELAGVQYAVVPE